jgi:hypothetical protein
MIDKLGVIPAAGRATRWGGVLKELLPIHEKETLIKHTLNAMSTVKCDAVVIVTNREKLQSHASHLEDWSVYYAVQFGGKDIWSAIVESLPIHGRMNYFAMPDTYYPVDIFSGMSADFSMGYFETEKTERFGIITDLGIINKQTMPEGIYRAWGILAWSDKVAEYWMDNVNEIESYTHAFNMAISKFGYDLKHMDYYYDLATIEDYKELINVI